MNTKEKRENFLMNLMLHLISNNRLKKRTDFRDKIARIIQFLIENPTYWIDELVRWAVEELSDDQSSMSPFPIGEKENIDFRWIGSARKHATDSGGQLYTLAHILYNSYTHNADSKAWLKFYNIVGIEFIGEPISEIAKELVRKYAAQPTPEENNRETVRKFREYLDEIYRRDIAELFDDNLDPTDKGQEIISKYNFCDKGINHWRKLVLRRDFTSAVDMYDCQIIQMS